MRPGRPEVFTFHDLVLENEASGWPQDRRSAPHPGVGYPPIDDRHALNNFVSLPAPPSTAPSTSRGDHERRAINERQLRRRCEITQSTCPRNRIRPKAGCDDVQSYIQSGNVVFRATPALAQRLPVLVAK